MYCFALKVCLVVETTKRLLLSLCQAELLFLSFLKLLYLSTKSLNAPHTITSWYKISQLLNSNAKDLNQSSHILVFRKFV